jgi:hypothetical protein
MLVRPGVFQTRLYVVVRVGVTVRVVFNVGRTDITVPLTGPSTIQIA